MDQFLSLVIVHSLPTNKLLSLSLLFDSVKRSTNHQCQTQISREGNWVPVQYTRESNAEHDACGHDERKNHGSKVLNGIKNEELAYRTADAKHEEVQMNFRMLHDKGQGGPQLMRVYQSNETQHCGEGTGGEHEFDDAEIEVAVEESRLELARERIKKEKETKEHDSRPLG